MHLKELLSKIVVLCALKAAAISERVCVLCALKHGASFKMFVLCALKDAAISRISVLCVLRSAAISRIFVLSAPRSAAVSKILKWIFRPTGGHSNLLWPLLGLWVWPIQIRVLLLGAIWQRDRTQAQIDVRG